jgi:hypothetical protein
MRTSTGILVSLVLLLTVALGLVGEQWRQARNPPRYAEVWFSPPKLPPDATSGCFMPSGTLCPMVHRVQAGYRYEQLEDGRFVGHKK